MMDRDEVARVLGLPRERVRIVPSACGGGFGGKLDVSVQPMLAVAAWHLKRPVRCVYERIEIDGRHHQAPPRQHPRPRRLRRRGPARQLRVRRRFQHWRLRVLGADGGGPRARAWRGTVSRAARAQPLRARSTPTTRPPAPSAASACRRRPSRTRRCSTICADKAGLDRLEFRHLNALRAGDTTPTGQVLEASVGLAAVPRRAAAALAGAAADAAAFNASARPHSPRRRHRLHVVRHRQHRRCPTPRPCS